MKVSKSVALSAAVAGLLAGSVTIVAPTTARADDKVACYNSCNGKHACGGAAKKVVSQSCAGNLKYSKMMTEKACKKAHGTTQAASTPATGGAAAPAAGGGAPAAGSEAPKQ